ncbi:MAG: cytochrome bc complex cytochrome b subunit [Haloplanus sp.]
MTDDTTAQVDPTTDGDARADGGVERYEHSRLYRWLDARLDLDDDSFGKAFPDDRYGSFLLGEVALFSFVILAATGTFLGLMYTPHASEVVYQGQVAKYAGQSVPGAFASVLRISYDVRFGMFVRMAHHWAAYLFLAAIGLHMFRVFFTGAYRNPREPNWLVGSGLLMLALGEGYFGYALPYDDFSQTATTIGFKMTASIPVVGTALKNLIFGGDFPANATYILPRFFFYHVYLLPALIVGLVGLHMFILLRQKHTEHPSSSREVDRPDGPAPDDDSVVLGVPMWPNQVAMSVVVFLFTAAIVSFLAALFPVQRVAIIGPASPLTQPSGVRPDWFFMWVFGALKMTPSVFMGYGRFVGGVLFPTVVIGVMALWAFIDRHDDPIHFTANPLDRPMPTAVGVAAISMIIVLSIAGMDTFVAETLGTSADAIYPYMLGATLLVPPLEGLIVYYALRRRQARGGD